MDFTTSLKTCFVKKYCCFRGRASRSEYWWFILVTIIFNIIISLLSADLPNLGLIINFVVAITIILPSIGVQVRRLHDTDHTGWWAIAWLVPVFLLIIGAVHLCIILFLVLTVWMLYLNIKKGTVGSNRFGSDPLLPDVDIRKDLDADL